MVEEENVKTLKGTKKKIDIETRRKINYKQTVEISVGAINNQQWTFQRHKQQYAQDTERRQQTEKYTTQKRG